MVPAKVFLENLLRPFVQRLRFRELALDNKQRLVQGSGSIVCCGGTNAQQSRPVVENGCHSRVIKTESLYLRHLLIRRLCLRVLALRSKQRDL